MAKPEITIVWQISNFHSFKAGPQIAPILGDYRQIQEGFSAKFAKDFFIIGFLVVMGLYHLVMFTLYTRDKSSLWFGIYCLQISGFSLIVNGHLNSLFTNTLLWELQVKVYYGIFTYLAVPVFLLLI